VIYFTTYTFLAVLSKEIITSDENRGVSSFGSYVDHCESCMYVRVVSGVNV